MEGSANLNQRSRICPIGLYGFGCGRKRPTRDTLSPVLECIAAGVSQGIAGTMLRKRYYIVFVARDEDGQLRKIPLPLKYAYGFLVAAIIGAFTIVGLAGSYTRMLLKPKVTTRCARNAKPCARITSAWKRSRTIAAYRSRHSALWPTK